MSKHLLMLMHDTSHGLSIISTNVRLIKEYLEDVGIKDEQLNKRLSRIENARNDIMSQLDVFYVTEKEKK